MYLILARMMNCKVIANRSPFTMQKTLKSVFSDNLVRLRIQHSSIIKFKKKGQKLIVIKFPQ